MKSLRNRFERFCFKHRSKGIPNLMLYIVLGSGLVYLLSHLGYTQLYNILRFDRAAILQGQVWRLFTYVFVLSDSNIFLTLILLYCYYSLGNAMERAWGTLRFNLFYLSGVILMDIYAMCLGGIVVSNYDFSFYYSASMITYLNLSLVISFATLYPDTHFLIFFIIPVKAWILAAIYLLITFYEVLTMSMPLFLFPHNLFPLVALANYFLFFGKDVLNVLPISWRAKLRPSRKPAQPKAKVVQFRPAGGEFSQKERPNYTHKCSICGKTDVSDPELEFRYCSRCTGYHCYCIEHINNHAHIEE